MKTKEELIAYALDRLEATLAQPDVTQHYPDPDYLRGLILMAKLNKTRAAQALGITDRTLRRYLSGTTPIPYTVQYTLEELARGASLAPRSRSHRSALRR